MPKKYKAHSTAEKKEYSKQFTKKEIAAYRAGSKKGFLDGVHAPKRTNK